jgi:hypothetical protein
MRTKFAYRNHRGVIEERDVDIVSIHYDYTLHPEYGYDTPGWVAAGWDYSRERNGTIYRSFRLDNIVVPKQERQSQHYELLALPKVLPWNGIPGADNEPLNFQTARLGTFILDEFPGEPSQNQGAIDTAIRLLRQFKPHRKVWDEEIEARAKEIFDAMPYEGPGAVGEKPEWVPHGNSLKQDEARALARAEKEKSNDPSRRL